MASRFPRRPRPRPDIIDQYQRAAGYIDRILRGEKPADLPVQAPTKYELVVVWVITNWVGKPIVDVREKRIKALQAAEQNAHVGYGALNERTREARAALNEAASSLRSISRGHGWPVQLYCRFARYDMEAAANQLIRLHNMTGEFVGDDKARQIALDAIYIFLRAHHPRLSKERIDEIRMRIEVEERLSKEKL